jgi:hypothetical protein
MDRKTNRSRFGQQSGQALLLGLLLLIAGALMLLALFSSGQVLNTRQRLTDAADAAALSAATWRARALNYVAYTNRAIVAQEVALAQAVTLASWARHLETLTQNAETLSVLHPPVAPVLSMLAALAKSGREATDQAVSLEMEWRADTNLGYKVWLARSQEWLLRSADVFALGALANEVARATDSRFFAFALGDGGQFARFTETQDSPEAKQRVRELITSSLDAYTANPRSTDIRLPLPSSCAGRSGDLNRWTLWLRRRGGTGLHETLETWSAIDTTALHDWRPRGFLGLGGCSDREAAPLGWGLYGEPVSWAGAQREAGRVNPASTSHALFTWGLGSNGAAGIPIVRDLSAIRAQEPAAWSSQLAVLARVDLAKVSTAARVGASVGRLRLSDGDHPSRLAALSAAEVYFSPPPDSATLPQSPSLFSPFWQARLVKPSEVHREAASRYVR